MGITHYSGLSISGTAQLAGAMVIPSAANAVAGIKSIGGASAGSGVVANTSVKSSSRILLTPIPATATYVGVSAWVSTIASGQSFTIKLGRAQTSGTQATASGRVSYLIINK